jgi:hypothetical protein
VNEIANDLLPFVPEQYRPKVMLAIMLSPYITRAFYALRTGGGLRGIVRSIWFGTNTPPGLTGLVSELERQTDNITKP